MEKNLQEINSPTKVFPKQCNFSNLIERRIKK